MSITCEVDRFSPSAWSQLCSGFADYSIYQTWAFGQISAQDSAAEVSRIVVRNNDEVIGAAQVRVKSLPLLQTGLAYVYFGPIGASSAEGSGRLAQLMEGIRREYAVKRRLHLRVVPNLFLPQSDASMFATSVDGFRWSSRERPYRTFMVDLSRSEDELRKSLAQKWRNGLNQAQKRGVAVESRTDDGAMRVFEELYDTMWARKQFETGVTVSSFCQLQQLLPAGEKMNILLAYKDGVLAAGHVSSTLGGSCIYLLGASNDVGRDCKASYLLQWTALIAAKRAGAAWYDLGGIDPEANPGVYHFKAGLGGADTSFVGRLDAPAPGMGRILVPLSERIFRAVRRLRQRVQSNEKADDRARREPEEGRVCPTVAKLSS